MPLDRILGPRHRVHRGMCETPEAHGLHLSLRGFHDPPSSDNLLAGMSIYAAAAEADPGTTDRVSVTSTGKRGNGESLSQSISADGRFVAFASHGCNLVRGDTKGILDALVHD